jgi:pimeloyl-ACP methyl ester carboxylesterase
MIGTGKVSWRMIGGEIAALGTVALSMPFRWLALDEHLDRAGSGEPPPVVFVHGLLGDPTNFIVLRGALGGRSFASFSYSPRLHYQALAGELGRFIEGVCAATGAARVDLVGHSLGGLVARYLVETGGRRLVRRLVTLGAPYYTTEFPQNELAIFAGEDPIVAAPDAVAARPDRVCVIPDCGHIALLYHPTVLQAVAAYLCRPPVALATRHAA